ncbi:hypothetical protein C1645_818562 [Glomus cerebriforme]|uniref:Uncharacterized protein n=1 Tax=Glomus cerebriforme TaxID=658196 RepID=A0A397T7B2_9GLOM|nr:hypothetical protein C1645_818562 [Glomus cerebriforme]
MTSSSQNNINYSSLIGFFYQHGIGYDYYYIGKKFNQVTGDYFFPRDYNKAFEWYSKLSEGGNYRVMCMLARCYKHGYGVKKDEKKAFELYLKSAEGVKDI